jgi:hypothetical protein
MSFCTKHREALSFVTHTDPSTNRPDSRSIFPVSAVMHLAEHCDTLSVHNAPVSDADRAICGFYCDDVSYISRHGNEI